MELNSKTIHGVIHPTAAFSQPDQPHGFHSAGGSEAPAHPWLDSQLNPKNRIDSLEPLRDPLWRIDGSTGFGTQFYAVPLFLGNVRPMRFDVFIPEQAALSPLLRELLDLGAAFHTKDASRVQRLGIARYILRALQLWSIRTGLTGPDSIEDMFQTFPFGSRIVFENLDLNYHKIRITIAQMHNLERQLLSISKLGDLYGIPQEGLPEAVDISRVSVLQQLHDSVCLVHIDFDGRRGDAGLQGERSSGPWILKALTSGTKYLYHELRALLDMPPHQHVISRPTYLLTKYCRFGGKTAVLGFVLPFHSGGSLRDHLPLLRYQGRLRMKDQLKWAIQLASALIHVRERGRMFYPDLRLDNVVLSASSDVVMVDFEQRGVWCEFGPPEVNSLEYVRILASDDPSSDDTGDHPSIPEEIQQRYAALMSHFLPGWEAVLGREGYISSPRGYDSYNIPWLCLSTEEQEAAEVYMLGRVLWCLFEGQSAPQLAAVWQSYQREPDLEFPRFQRTPQELRGLIDSCTRGRRLALSSTITRRGSKLVLRDVLPHHPQGAEQVMQAAREWWVKEIEAAEVFLQMRDDLKARGQWNDNYYGRPKLREVLAALETYKAKMASEDLDV